MSDVWIVDYPVMFVKNERALKAIEVEKGANHNDSKRGDPSVTPRVRILYRDRIGDSADGFSPQITHYCILELKSTVFNTILRPPTGWPSG